ncbi:MAG: hypothetical protein C4522_09355 [Desulfobacteraceae bacterium]|nr:MAG: hypothetical protein C4522_09355 [Desulfobacteraceae bacterium]
MVKCHRISGRQKQLINRLKYTFPIFFFLITFSFDGHSEEFKGEESLLLKQQETIINKNASELKTPYSIQVGAYLQKKNAENMLIDLRTKGYEPYIFKTVTSKKQPFYLIRIGNYENIRQASFAANQFKKLEKIPAIVTRYNSSTPIPYKDLALNETANNYPMDIINVEELSGIDGRAGTLIDSDELAIIDGRSGTLVPEDEMARIDAQTGTIMPIEELSTIDGQTGTIISQQDLATIDGQTATTMSPGDLATIDGQTATTMSPGDLATVDGQTATTMSQGDLAKTDAQTASMISQKNLSEVAAQAASVMPGEKLSSVNAQAAGTDIPSNESEPFFLAAQESEDSDPPFLNEKSEASGAIDSAMAKQLREQIELLEERVNELREEADVRKILEITEEEKQQEEEEILSATGRDYTMSKKGYIGADYSFSYTYNSYDAISNAFEVEHQASHNLTNTVSLTYAVRDNLTIGVGIPFVYAYDNMGTAKPKDVTDLGDINIDTQWQPLKAGGNLPAPILSFSYTLPTGRSPYEINPENELSTGSGTSGFDIGLSLSKSFDPIMTFGGISYGKSFEITSLNNNRYGATLDSVDPGQNIGARMGLGYAISYKLTVNISLSYTYSFGSEYHYTTGTTPVMDSASASFSLGTGWRISPKRSLNVSFSKGLSIGGGDFSISFRVPFNF